MPFGPTDVFWIGVVPSAVAALVMWATCRLALRPTAAWTLSAAAGIILGIVAQNVRVGWPIALDKLFHPRVALDWLPWLVLGAAAINLLAAYTPRTFQRWLVALACVFAISVPLRLLAGSVYVTSRWTPTERLGVLAIWSLVFAFWWLTLAFGRQNPLPLVRSGLLLIVAFGISLSLAASGAITLGELGGVTAATIFAATAVSWLTGTLADGPSNAAGPLAVTLGSLIFLGYYYSQLTLPNVALLALSLAASAGYLPLPLDRRSAAAEDGRGGGASRQIWASITIRAALALVPLAIAAASAVATALANPYG
jgi:hypothetical protein